MSVVERLRGRLAAARLYGVKVALDTGTADLPGTEYGPRYLERRHDDPQRVTDQVSMLFDKLPTYDADSRFAMPGVTHQASG